VTGIEGVVGALGSVVLLLGLALVTIGLYGMLRRPPIFEQLHASGLVTGPGVILVLLASLASGSAEIATSAVLVGAFILVTAPLSAHAIALTAWRRRRAGARAGSAAEGGRPGADRRRAPGAPTPMRVLIAHDGTPAADVATELAASVRWGAGSSIRVLAAIEGDIDPLPSERPVESGAPVAPELAAALEAAAARLEGPGLAVDHGVRRGEPSTAIAAEAADLDADLVIIGTRGIGPVRTLLGGSVAAAVADAAPCPVLVARLPTAREVLLATDGSPASEPAIEAVARWPMFEGVRVRVLSVAASVRQYGDPTPGGPPGDTDEGARGRETADAAVARLRAAGRQAEPAVRAGEPAAAIREFAEAEGIELVVLGSRGRTGLRRALLGSVARDVLGSAEVSVLVVRTRDR
jgi:monovalent cation/proton antiporter MnhG/PhaG subunit